MLPYQMSSTRITSTPQTASHPQSTKLLVTPCTNPVSRYQPLQRCHRTRPCIPASSHLHLTLSDVIHAHHQHTPNSVTSTIHQIVGHPVYQPCQSVPTATALSSHPSMHPSQLSSPPYPIRCHPRASPAHPKQRHIHNPPKCWSPRVPTLSVGTNRYSAVLVSMHASQLSFPS